MAGAGFVDGGVYHLQVQGRPCDSYLGGQTSCNSNRLQFYNTTNGNTYWESIATGAPGQWYLRIQGGHGGRPDNCPNNRYYLGVTSGVCKRYVETFTMSGNTVEVTELGGGLLILTPTLIENCSNHAISARECRYDNWVTAANPAAVDYYSHFSATWVGGPGGSPSAAPSLLPTAYPVSYPTLSIALPPTTSPVPVPTPQPSTAPSLAPTVHPVPPVPVPTFGTALLPTAAPVPGPSAAPALAPTTSPVPLPSAVPSHGPTVAPARTPTASPAQAPSAAPVPGPTAAPVSAPTAAPVLGPTTAPVPGPTAAPVPDPTTAPVPGPTAAPVPGPTTAPVPGPTAAPVLGPTTAPVQGPTTAPVQGPTAAPVLGPTAAPVSAPTAAPVLGPTTAPVPGPTTAPVLGPSAAPAPAPTAAPVLGPTTAPVPGPSAPPRAPTTPPIPAPSAAPGQLPTGSPVQVPTAAPTRTGGSPSAAPVHNPTGSPDGEPTGAPVPAPTAAPVPAPTGPPAQRPTASPRPAPTTPPAPLPTGRTAPPAGPSVSPTSGATAAPAPLLTAGDTAPLGGVTTSVLEASALPAVFASGSAGSLATLVLLSQERCGEDAHHWGGYKDNTLSPLLHPLRFRLVGDIHAGAVVGNMCIALTFCLLQIITVHGVRPLLARCGRSELDIEMQLALPSVYFSTMFVLNQGSSYATGVLLFRGLPDSDLPGALVGVAGLAGLVAAVPLVTWRVVLRGAVTNCVYETDRASGVRRWLLGQGEWCSRPDAEGWHWRLGHCLWAWRPESAQRAALAMLAECTGLSAIAALRKTTYTQCVYAHVGYAAVTAAHGAWRLWANPAARPRDSHCELARTLFTTCSMIIRVVAYASITQRQVDAHFSVASGLLLAAAALMALNILVHALCWVYLRSWGPFKPGGWSHIGRRALLQQRVEDSTRSGLLCVQMSWTTTHTSGTPARTGTRTVSSPGTALGPPAHSCFGSPVISSGSNRSPVDFGSPGPGPLGRGFAAAAAQRDGADRHLCAAAALAGESSDESSPGMDAPRGTPTDWKGPRFWPTLRGRGAGSLRTLQLTPHSSPLVAQSAMARRTMSCNLVPEVTRGGRLPRAATGESDTLCHPATPPPPSARSPAVSALHGGAAADRLIETRRGRSIVGVGRSRRMTTTAGPRRSAATPPRLARSHSSTPVHCV